MWREYSRPPNLLAQVRGGEAGSPDWTRTSNRPINSRMLCQLSYGGPALLWRRVLNQNNLPSGVVRTRWAFLRIGTGATEPFALVSGLGGCRNTGARAAASCGFWAARSGRTNFRSWGAWPIRSSQR